MKPLLFSFVFASLAMLATAAVAAPPSEEAEKVEKAEKAEKAKKADKQGKRETDTLRRPGGPPRDPAALVARILNEFDTDGDEKLDQAELTAWLKAMQQRRGQFFGGDRPERKPVGPRGKRLREADQGGTPGGDRPRRPPAEG